MSNKEKKVSKKKKGQEKKPVPSSKNKKYTIINNVWESGKMLKIGNEYNGKNIELFLEKGYIKQD